MFSMSALVLISAYQDGTRRCREKVGERTVHHKMSLHTVPSWLALTCPDKLIPAHYAGPGAHIVAIAVAKFAKTFDIGIVCTP